MASTYTTRLRLEKPGQGEQPGTWGITANTDYDLIDQGIAGVVNVTHDNAPDYTLTALSGSPDEARNLALVIGGTLTANRNVICPSVQKVYLVRNATVGGFAITIKTAAGTGIQIANGFNRWVYCDGTNVLAGGAAFNPGTNTLSGTMETATRWSTARNLTVSGDATGSLTSPWDGSANAVLNITIPGLAQAGVQSISLAGTSPRSGQVTITEGDTVNTLLGGNVVRTFQGATTRTGNITLTSGDVTWALGYTPIPTFNGRSGAITLTATDVTTALGATAVQNAVAAQSATTATNFNGTIAGSQVQGNISGNAASITGSVNGNQVVGNISGNAAGISGTLGISNGGTGSTSAAGARSAIGAAGLGANVFSGSQEATGFAVTNGLNLGPASLTFSGGQESVFTQGGQVQIAAGGAARLLVSSSQVTSNVGISAPAFNNTSDRSMKVDVEPVSGALNRVLAYGPVTYKWAPSVSWSDGRTHEGFIAQDVEIVNPIAVSYVDGVATLDAMAVIADLVGAVQTLHSRLAALEAAQ